MAKKRITDLGDLKQIKFKKGKEDIYTLPYEKKNEVQEEKVNPPSAPPDEEIFLNAMQGVNRIDGSAGRQVSPSPSHRPATASPEEKPQHELNRFMRGDVEFELEYTDEFLYGYVRGLDIKTFQQLKSGSLSVAAHLDLHGMTLDQAQASLLFFIKEGYLQSHRCVLVVTGRGRNSPGGQGVLRSEVSTWLTKDPLRRVVLAFCTAQPKDGGAGAVYVLLRKQKKTRGKVRWDIMPGGDNTP